MTQKNEEKTNKKEKIVTLEAEPEIICIEDEKTTKQTKHVHDKIKKRTTEEDYYAKPSTSRQNNPEIISEAQIGKIKHLTGANAIVISTEKRTPGGRIVIQSPEDRKEPFENVPAEEKRNPRYPRTVEAVRRIKQNLGKFKKMILYKTAIWQIRKETAYDIKELEKKGFKLIKETASDKIKMVPCQWYQIDSCLELAPNDAHKDKRFENYNVYSHICDICLYIRKVGVVHNVKDCDLLKEIDQIENNKDYQPFLFQKKEEVKIKKELESVETQTDNEKEEKETDDRIESMNRLESEFDETIMKLDADCILNRQ